MKTQNTQFKDVKLFYPEVYKDDRGFFMESFNSFIPSLAVVSNQNGNIP